MADRRTRWQKLTGVIANVGNGSPMSTRSATYNITPPLSTQNGQEILYSSSSKEERDQKLAQLKQQKLMSYLWAKTGYDTAMEQAVGANQVRVMYRDADLMAAWPEIGAALECIAEEATTVNTKGKILNIYSKSERIKSVLEDLFYNRLDIPVWLTTIVHETAKYGNEFMFLNLDLSEGVKGWRELPVHEMQRIENGMDNVYGSGMFNADFTRLNPDEVKFVWQGHNEDHPFKSWMIAHFRLITDSIFLPYGCSWLNKARRHWRMLSMMEDAMLLYRLERSIERRVFKVNVGAIDDKDVPAFIQEFMNGIKRAPIIDPQTGQMDLRKNFLDVSADYVIPVRPGADPTSIETLQSAQNTTSMEDIQYTENKILCALRVPKPFLNFQEAQSGGKAQNLSLVDIRFNRVINNIQKAIIMELNKIAIIHLYLLGFEDELTNFTLTLNNPSNQIEQMELDNLNKRLAAAQSALAEQGGGIPIMSWHQVQREIMGRTDTEIEQTLNEIRLEAALAIEIQRTAEIIKRTHMFDKVDRIFGEPGAEYNAQPPGQEGGMGGIGGGMGGPPPIGDGFGEDLGSLGAPGEDESGDIGGDEGGANLGGMDANSPAPLSESMINAVAKGQFYNAYMRDFLNADNSNDEALRPIPIMDKNLLVNEEINSILHSLDKQMKENDKVSPDLDEEIQVLMQ